MPREVVVLVSAGRHPVSLTPRLADLDGRALALAGRLGAPVVAVHAGPAANAAPLRSSLGMGAGRLVIIEVPAEADPLPALRGWLTEARPHVVLSGQRAEAGEASGMVPYWLAERMGWALVSNVIDLSVSDSVARATQALPRGRRRVVEAPVPVVLTVDRTAPDARLSALAPALRGTIERVPGAPVPPDERMAWPTRPARRRPRPLLAAGADAPATARRELIGPDPTEAADAILDFLERESLIVMADGPDAAAPGSGVSSGVSG